VSGRRGVACEDFFEPKLQLGDRELVDVSGNAPPVELNGIHRLDVIQRLLGLLNFNAELITLRSQVRDLLANLIPFYAGGVECLGESIECHIEGRGTIGHGRFPLVVESALSRVHGRAGGRSRICGQNFADYVECSLRARRRVILPPAIPIEQRKIIVSESDLEEGNVCHWGPSGAVNP
jgi:hypothetical protein